MHVPDVPPPRSGSRWGARDAALIASFTALIAVLGLPGALTLASGVPITLQTLGVMLAGSILGARRAMASVALLLVLVALGLPLLAGGRGGLAVFAGPSVGYLIGWVVGAGVIGWLVARKLPRYPLWWGAVANVIGGIAVVYAIGIPVQAFILGTSGIIATAIAATAYLPGDVIKVVIATGAAAAVHRAYPDLLVSRREVSGPVTHE